MYAYPQHGGGSWSELHTEIHLNTAIYVRGRLHDSLGYSNTQQDWEMRSETVLLT